MNLLLDLPKYFFPYLCQILIISLFIISFIIYVLYWTLNPNIIIKDIESTGGRLIFMEKTYISKYYSMRPLRGIYNIYKIQYVDSGERNHLAVCRIGLLSGITWLEDKVIEIK